MYYFCIALRFSDFSAEYAANLKIEFGTKLQIFQEMSKYIWQINIKAENITNKFIENLAITSNISTFAFQIS